MNRRRADTVVGVLVAAVLLGGGALSWQAYRRQRAIDQSMGSMMDSSVGSVHGPDPLWYVLGTLLVAAAIGGVYVLVREESSSPDVNARTAGESSSPGRAARTDSTPGGRHPSGSINPEAHPQARLLDLLPDDERRILEPVIASPGITQIELRDRSDFSKSKVSQTASALEKRGLLYRERQGRTYRVYPSDDLEHQQPEPE